MISLLVAINIQAVSLGIINTYLPDSSCYARPLKNAMDSLKCEKTAAFYTQVNALLAEYLLNNDSTNYLNILHSIILDCAMIGEYGVSTTFCDKYIRELENCSSIDEDDLKSWYYVIMEIAKKAKMYQTEASYGKKYSRRYITIKDGCNIEGFAKFEKQIIKAFINAENYKEALLEIHYVDSCLSKYVEQPDIHLGQYLKMMSHIANGRYDLAYRESLDYMALMKKNGIRQNQLEDIHEIADVMVNVCDYEKAISIMQNYFEIIKYDTDSKKACLNIIGDYYLLAKDYVNADKCFRESEILNYLGPEKTNQVSSHEKTFDNGDVYIDTGAVVYDVHASGSYFSVALVNYKLGNIEAGDIYRKKYLWHIAESGKRYIGDYTNRVLMLESARYEALREYEEAITLTKELIGKGEKSFGDLLEDLSKLYLKSGQINKAFELATEIIQKKRHLIINNFDALSREEKARFWNRKSDIFTLQKQAALLSDDPLRGSILYDDIALFAKGLLLTASSNTEYKSILKTTWKDVQKKLMNNQLAIEFIAVESINENPDSTEYIALVIDKKSKQPNIIHLCKAHDLDIPDFNQIKTLSMTKLKSFFELIWAKIGIVDNNIKKIYFSTDGALHSLPLEFVMRKCGNSRMSLYRLTSTRELVRKYPKNKSKKSVLYGGLIYKDKDFIERELKYSGDEINEAESSLSREGQRCIIFKGESGTSASLFQLDKQKIAVLHIATHGFTDDATNKDNAMMHTGLVMSDRKVTSEEISNIHFDGLGLVVLSACGSGLGKISNGEGVYGLQRAFKMSGVKTVLMTLWDIVDGSAFKFMKEFYNKLCHGANYEKALLDTQNELMNHYVPGYGYPYEKDCAAFVLLDAID